jgi:hypothetical protein
MDENIGFVVRMDEDMGDMYVHAWSMCTAIAKSLWKTGGAPRAARSLLVGSRGDIVGACSLAVASHLIFPYRRVVARWDSSFVVEGPELDSFFFNFKFFFPLRLWFEGF